MVSLQARETLECVICSEVLEDPRALPCGHSFCGPPRRCIELLQTGDSLKCALCNKIHKIRSDQLQPLYGIRDVLKHLSDASTGTPKLRLPVCEDHGAFEKLFYCSDCQLSMCDSCVDQHHDGHSVKRFKNELRSQVQMSLDKFNNSVNVKKQLTEREINHRKEIRKNKSIIANLEQKINQLEEIRRCVDLIDKEQENLNSFLADKSDNIDYATIDTIIRVASTFDHTLQHKITSADSLEFNVTISEINQLLVKKELTSAAFIVAGIKFWVVAQLNSDSGERWLDLFLECAPTQSQFCTSDWRLLANFELTLQNQLGVADCALIDGYHCFDRNFSSWGNNFVKWESLLKPEEGWLTGHDEIHVQCKIVEVSFED